MTTLVGCWNKLEGNVTELSSWVENKEPAAQFDENAVIPIEKLEGQLNQLKVMFEEKQKLVAELEAYSESEKAAAQQNNPVEVKHIQCLGMSVLVTITLGQAC